MKVIFKNSGEVKEVSLGYAVNYLLPKQLAEKATASRISDIQAKKAAAAKTEQVKIDESRQMAERFDGKVVNFDREAGKGGQIHGSITKKEIADALKILKINVVLSKPIKKVGEYPVELKFGTSRATVKVKVK
jgi:large subunit ribosomal protein L9